MSQLTVTNLSDIGQVFMTINGEIDIAAEDAYAEYVYLRCMN